LAALPATGLGQRSVGQLEEENRRLRREVRHLAQQRDILKKRWASLPHRPAAI
jgi:FtsZ-binding cell division protein ZapB